MSTRICKYVACLLGVLSAVLLVLLTQMAIKLQQAKADVRLTRDLIFRYDSEREQALNGDVSQAVQYLQMFDIPPNPDELGNKYLADILGYGRKEAVRDIIAYLQTKTGKDLGDDPGKWIEALKDAVPGSEAP